MKPRSHLLHLALIATALCGSAAQAAEPAKNDPKHRSPSIDFLSCAKPEYPADALKAARTGKVTLNFLIDVDGHVVETQVKRSSGHADLDEAAREGLSKCKFMVGTQAGVPIQDWTTIQYVWTLK
ncbi:MAG: energy transducer TonB [Massilia sp.]